MSRRGSTYVLAHALVYLGLALMLVLFSEERAVEIAGIVLTSIVFSGWEFWYHRTTGRWLPPLLTPA